MAQEPILYYFKGRCLNYEASPCEYYMACRFPWESTFVCTTQLYLYSAPATILQVDYSVALQTGIVSIVFYFSAKAFCINSQITQKKGMKFPRFSIKNSQDFQSYLLPLHHLILSDKVFSLLLLAERPSSLHERCLYTIFLAPHYRSYERLDSKFRPHTLSFSKTIQSAPGPMLTRLTASAGCKPKLRFSNIIHTFAVYGFQQ